MWPRLTCSEQVNEASVLETTHESFVCDRTPYWAILFMTLVASRLKVTPIIYSTGIIKNSLFLPHPITDE